MLKIVMRICAFLILYDLGKTVCERGGSDVLISQYDATYLENFGLVKLVFLSVNTGASALIV